MSTPIRIVSRATYTDTVNDVSPLEDRHGVDVAQIRAQLRMPVKERVRVMVEAANRMIEIQDHARAARETRAV